MVVEELSEFLVENKWSGLEEAQDPVTHAEYGQVPS